MNTITEGATIQVAPGLYVTRARLEEMIRKCREDAERATRQGDQTSAEQYRLKAEEWRGKLRT